MNIKDNKFAYTCNHCKTEFKKNDLREYKYCSRSCYHASRIGMKITNVKEEKKERKLINHHCKWCNKEFTSLSSAGARSIYCTRSCQGFAFASRNKTPKDFSDIDASYIAAMIDGEGTISIIDRKYNRPKSSRHSVKISIANTYEPLITWLIATTGLGSIHKDKVKEGRKDCYKWVVHSYSALHVLKKVKNYMKEKKYLAEKAIRCLAEADQNLD